MLIAHDIARALNPLLFAEACGVTPDQWQADLLHARPRKALLNCSRQSGKTTVAALMGLETACHTPNCLALIGAPAQRQSGEMLRTVKGLHAKLDDAPAIVSESVLKVELANGSRIMALPGDAKTVRGLAAPAIIIIDEAAHADSDYIAALRPMLATSNGSLIALSTPNGCRGWFWEQWHNGDPAWTRVRVPASECPRISKEFLAEQLREGGPTLYAQEFECAFVDNDSSAFPSTIIDRAFTTEVLPLWV